MENLSNDERILIFNENYPFILDKIRTACQKISKPISEITLLAATKTVPVEVINYATQNGIAFIGENRVQEFLSKESFFNDKAERHFIGHLQSNKVKDIIGRVKLIHSVHSLKLAEVIGKQSKELGIVTDILIEINIGAEESKSGFLAHEAEDAIRKIARMEGVAVKGLMAIPPICEKSEENRRYFSQMNKLFVDIKDKKIDNSNMFILSMGMSDDFDVAIEEGSNLVRIGSALFGKRNYN